jgi:phage baseplate assembly protein W
MRTGLAPRFPLLVDTDLSDYNLVTDTPELVRQNLKNLILTSPGERIMDPEFGVGIRQFLFENRIQGTLTSIRNRIGSQVRKYMPFVSITSIDFSTAEENENYLGITINYVISAIRTSDTLRIDFNLTNSP